MLAACSTPQQCAFNAGEHSKWQPLCYLDLADFSLFVHSYYAPACS